MLSVQPLQPSQFEDAADLLAAAFVGDKGMVVLFPNHNKTQLKSAMRHWYLMTLKLWQESNQPLLCVTDGGKVLGVLIASDTNKKVRWNSQLKWLVAVALKTGFAPVFRAIEHDTAREKAFQELPACIVEFVAVSPKIRGQGAGRLLFERLHSAYKGQGSWLETTKEENLLIFSKLGYEHIGINVSHDVDHHQMKIQL